jgi:LysR family nitrogen assimilation transcriptional regulator
MDLRQLRSFVAVVESGSFSRAAVELGMTQQGLSQQIANLEQELGVALLTRTARGVTMRDTGQTLLEHARLVLRQVDQAAAEVSHLGANPTGEVRLSVPATATETLAVPLLQEVERRLPGVALRLVSGLSAHALQLVRSGWIDCAIVAGGSDMDGLEAEPLIVEDLYLVSPPDAGPGAAEVPFATLAGLPLILPARPNSLRMAVEQHVGRDWQLDLKTEIEGLPLIKALVKVGYAHTVTSLAAVYEEQRRGELRVARLVDPGATRVLQLVVSSARPVTRATAEIRAMVRRMVRDLVTGGRWPGALAAQEEIDAAAPADGATGLR